MLRRCLIGLVIFDAISAIIGGFALFLAPDGSILRMPVSFIADSPFKDYFIPGLILAFLVGGSALIASISLLAKSDWSFVLTLISGAALSVWIITQVMMIGFHHPIQPFYGLIGLAIIILLLISRKAYRIPAGTKAQLGE